MGVGGIRAEDHYAALVASSDDAIVAKNLEGTIVSWNPAAERIFGYSAEEMIGQSIRRIIPEDRQDEEDRILGRVGRGERIEQLFTQRLRKDGSLIDLLLTVSPVKDAAGRIVGASKIARDATEFVAHQRRVEESEERFRMMADNISQLAWIAQPDGYIIWYNKRWYEYTGTTLEEMKGWGWKAVHHPDHVERVEKHFRRSIESGTEWEDTFPLRGTDGKYRWYLSRAKPIRDVNGEIVYWFGTNTDITAQREQEEQIRLLMMEVNHRAKNMLSLIQVLARRSAPDNEEFVDRFEGRIAGLAANQDLLIQRQWREVPIGELAASQLAFLGESLGQVETGGPELSVTPRAAEVIGMALHELGTNSIKYGALSNTEGRVVLEWTLVNDDSALRICWREKGGPPVEPPEREGFGTTLMRDVPQRSLDAKVSMDYDGTGICWTLETSAALAD